MFSYKTDRTPVPNPGKLCFPGMAISLSWSGAAPAAFMDAAKNRVVENKELAHPTENLCNRPASLMGCDISLSLMDFYCFIVVQGPTLSRTETSDWFWAHRCSAEMGLGSASVPHIWTLPVGPDYPSGQ